MEVQEEPLPLLLNIKNNNDENNHHRSSDINGQNGGNSDSESQDSFRNCNDPNRFNAYLNRGSELWTHWTWMGGQGKMSLMRCNYCNINKQLKNAPKCRRHLIKCQKTPEIVRKYFERKEIEASRVSAFMREIRSKEVKFPRNDHHQSQQQQQQQQQPSQAKNSDSESVKTPMPTANDLKHLQQKQQSKVTSNGTNGHTPKSSSSSSTTVSPSVSSSGPNKYSAVDLMKKTNILMNYSPMINRPSKNSSNQSTNREQLSSTPNNNNNLLNNHHHPKINKHNQQHQQPHQEPHLSPNGGESMINDINYNLICQLMSIAPMSSVSDSLDSSMSSNSSPILASKLKRKLDYQQMNSIQMNGKENSIIEHHSNNGNSKKNPKNISNSNTVVINLDDISMNDPIYFNSLENGHGESLMLNGGGGGGGGSRKKKRDSCNGNGFGNNRSPFRVNGGGNGYHVANTTNGNNNHQEFEDFDTHDMEIVHDDLNDLLLSALISQGIELDIVNNTFFKKFITQLVKFSANSKNYRLPTVDKLTTNNISNLIRKFDYETAKLFSECDSITVSFENNNDDMMMAQRQQRQPLTMHQKSISNSFTMPKQSFYCNHNGSVDGGGGGIILANKNKNARCLNVNLLISSSNTYLNLFFKKIICSRSSSSTSSSSLNNGCHDEIDVKTLNNQIDSLFNKLRSDQINAVILPYKDKKSSDLIYSYLSACHSHVVPLTNAYRLFHHLLCDICRIPSIFKLITKCMAMFQELEFNNNLFDEFHEENQNHWKQVFESDNLKIFNYFLSNKDGSTGLNDHKCSNNNSYWISLNLMLCWFLVARSSIIKLFEKEALNNNSQSDVNGGDDENIDHSKRQLNNNDILEKCQLEVGKLEPFFDQISILFNFLTPFINAMHLIENESTVISDIIKIYYDVKLAINNNNFFNGINIVCDKTERQAVDSILNDYLQEHNFSRYYFLAYYLDPRFRDDRRIEENEELTAQVYDALFNYANALGCVNNEEEDREKLVDSLEEFRNGDKLYGMQLLKCPKSPIKFWKHLRRFPGSAKLAFCAQRLLSISTKSMLITTPVEDPCTLSLYEHLSNKDPNDSSSDLLEYNAIEKILPMKSYLLSSSHKLTIVDDLESEQQPESFVGKNGGIGEMNNHHYNHCNGANDNGASPLKHKWNSSSISNIISNVIISLDLYARLIAQPFSTSDLSNFIQQTAEN